MFFGVLLDVVEDALEAGASAADEFEVGHDVFYGADVVEPGVEAEGFTAD